MVVPTIDSPLLPYAERELEHWYQCASRDQRRRGRSWYRVARQLLQMAADENGYTLEQAVAVLAITSPGTQLATNVSWTLAALESRGRARVGRFPGRMVPAVRAVLASPDLASEHVQGPKVGAFHRAILGARELVIDRWAYFAAAGGRAEDGDSKIDVATNGRASAVHGAYAAVARRHRLPLHELQAIVWIVARESTPSARTGKVPRLRDIHEIAREQGLDV